MEYTITFGPGRAVPRRSKRICRVTDLALWEVGRCQCPITGKPVYFVRVPGGVMVLDQVIHTQALLDVQDRVVEAIGTTQDINFDFGGYHDAPQHGTD